MASYLLTYYIVYLLHMDEGSHSYYCIGNVRRPKRRVNRVNLLASASGGRMDGVAFNFLLTVPPSL